MFLLFSVTMPLSLSFFFSHPHPTHSVGIVFPIHILFYEVPHRIVRWNALDGLAVDFGNSVTLLLLSWHFLRGPSFAFLVQMNGQ
jgi:hypothetical protein